MELIEDDEDFICEYATSNDTDCITIVEEEEMEEDCSNGSVQDLEIVKWSTLEEIESDNVIQSRLQDEEIHNSLEYCKSLSKKIVKEFHKETMEKKKSQLIKKEDLYDFNITYVKTIVIDGTREIQYHNSSYIQMLMEKVLCVSASEAVCERLFCHSSLLAKRQYVTKLNNDTVHDITFVKHYLKVMWSIFVKDMRMENVLK